MYMDDDVWTGIWEYLYLCDGVMLVFSPSCQETIITHTLWVRHGKTVIFLFIGHYQLLHDERKTILIHRLRLSLSLLPFCWRRLIRMHIRESLRWHIKCILFDIDFIHVDIQGRSCHRYHFIQGSPQIHALLLAQCSDLNFPCTSDCRLIPRQKWDPVCVEPNQTEGLVSTGESSFNHLNTPPDTRAPTQASPPPTMWLWLFDIKGYAEMGLCGGDIC